MGMFLAIEPLNSCATYAIFPRRRACRCAATSRLRGQNKEMDGPGEGTVRVGERSCAAQDIICVAEASRTLPQHMAMWVAIKPFNSCATDGHVVGHQTVQQLRNRWPSFRAGFHAHVWTCPDLGVRGGAVRVRGKEMCGSGGGTVRARGRNGTGHGEGTMRVRRGNGHGGEG